MLTSLSLIGVEFNQPDGKSAGWMAKEVAQECLSRGLMVLACGPYDTVRLIPALNVTGEDLAKGMDIFAEAVLSAVESCPVDVA